MAISFTIAKVTKTAKGVFFRDTNGNELELSGSIAEIRQSVADQYSDTGRNGAKVALMLAIAKALAIDPDLLTPSNIEGKTVTYDLTAASVLRIT